VARLIVLNGLPGIGKSAIARRYVDDHAFALALDLDSVRRLIGRWRDEPARAGLMARAMTLTLARDHLRSGYDVVLPQYLGRTEFLEQAQQVAEDAGAAFFEFILTDNRDEVVRRFNARTHTAARPEHVEAGELVAQLGGDDALFAMCDRLLLVTAARPNTIVVASPDGAHDEVYAEIRRRLEA
jgi:predicted kinase